MNLAPAAGIAIGAFIAFANGANDVSKGIATLAGSGATNLRKAVLWGAMLVVCVEFLLLNQSLFLERQIAARTPGQTRPGPMYPDFNLGI